MGKSNKFPILTVTRLKDLLHYDPITGIWVRIKVPRGANKAKIGDRAGWLDKNGRRYIQIDGRVYICARLAWFYMTSNWIPLVEHKDTNCSNDCWDNLRRATTSQNMANTKLRSTNTSGIKGVSWSKRSQQWYASITYEYKQNSLGLFNCPAAAAIAYSIAADKLFGNFARLR